MYDIHEDPNKAAVACKESGFWIVIYLWIYYYYYV
jgi:hypothetical protein